MRFEYEIPVDEYVAAQLLHYRLTIGLKRKALGAVWLFAGVLLLTVAGKEYRLDALGPVLLGAVGLGCIYVGAVNLFPSWYIRQTYRRSGVEGKRYVAEVSTEGFEVAGDVCSWRVSWAGVSYKGENEVVFMCQAANTVFTFGKRYLTQEQQAELRRLAGLPSR